MNQITNFVKTVVAKLTGDTAQETALLNEKQATAALKSQISSLEGQVGDQETLVDEATAALKDATYPSDRIVPKGASNQQDHRRAYIENLAEANDELKAAEDVLAETKASIEFYKNILKNASALVDAA